jgi:hypothetical protein
MRGRLLVITAVLATACTRPATSVADASPVDAGLAAAPPVPAGKRLVDVTDLHAQCLLSAIQTPPNVRSNHWQDAAKLEGGGKTYGWIMLEQSSALVPVDDAKLYLSGVIFLLDNRGMNAAGFCRPDWTDARAGTILTAVVLVGGDSTRGTFAVLGGTMTGTRPSEIVKDVSVQDARVKALAMASQAVGAKLTTHEAPSDWFEATEAR